MLIDWFTVSAQVINFLILVWLLKRLLYAPVLAAIDAREKKIAARLAEAAAGAAKAQSERDELRRQTESFGHERETLMRTAVDEANLERQRLVEAARNDAQNLRTRLLEAEANERVQFNRRFLEHAQEELFAMARKVLSDLAGVALQERMIDVFEAHLRQPGAHWREAAGAALSVPSTTPKNVLIRSAFELSAARRANLTLTVRECLGENVSVRFEDSPRLVCGLELNVEGLKLAWSVDDYLTSLSQQVEKFSTQEAPVGH